jgi:hypothetical protein
MRKFSILVSILLTLFLGVILAACGPSATPEPPIPTRTPMPTFTPTPEIVMTPVDPAAAATAKAAEAAAAANNAANVGGTDANQAAPTPAPAEPTATPEPSVVVSQLMNVRQGPGTNYPIIGQADAGQRYRVTGKNQAGNWWQVDFNGQAGWVFADLVTAEGTDAVAVAANIPAPPPTPTPVPPTATPIPQPTATPAPRYEFNIAQLQGCEPNAGVTYVQGTTYRNGQPESGHWVVFSYAPDGPIVAKVISGPHEGYPDWNAGFYSHLLQAGSPREGNWWFWITDDSGRRISEMAQVHTDGVAGPGKCQQATIDFDSR